MKHQNLDRRPFDQANDVCNPRCQSPKEELHLSFERSFLSLRLKGLEGKVPLYATINDNNEG